VLCGQKCSQNGILEKLFILYNPTFTSIYINVLVDMLVDIFFCVGGYLMEKVCVGGYLKCFWKKLKISMNLLFVL
tara:strand:+ start:28 stop:252 length:225 start_codon:yes stop_codon:yes gene_type:complete